MVSSKQADDMDRVKFIHEAVHERLINWARWCSGGRGGAGSSPMFRHYRAPRYQNATDHVHIPVDGLDAVQIEKVVGQLPDKHRDSLRYFYVYSHCGMSIWQAIRALGVQRDTLVKLIHDARSMLKNRLESKNVARNFVDRIHSTGQSVSTPVVPASLREAAVSVRQAEKPKAAEFAYKVAH